MLNLKLRAPSFRILHPSSLMIYPASCSCYWRKEPLKELLRRLLKVIIQRRHLCNICFATVSINHIPVIQPRGKNKLTMIRPNNDQRSLCRINAIRLISMTMSRVVALIIGIHLEQVLLLPLPCHGGEEVWDFVLLDLLPVTGDDEHAVDDAVWGDTSGGEAVDDVGEGVRHLKAMSVMSVR